MLLQGGSTVGLAAAPLVLLGFVVALSAAHMVAPDHWVPVTVAAHRKSYSRSRTLLLASGLGLGHGVGSAALSLILVAVGLLFFPAYYVNLAAVVLLLVIAAYVVVKATKETEEGTKAESVSVLVSLIPDPALVPFILVASGYGVAYTALMLASFVIAALASLVVVVSLASLGLSRALSKVHPRYVDYLVALALVLVAVFVYFAG